MTLWDLSQCHIHPNVSICKEQGFSLCKELVAPMILLCYEPASRRVPRQTMHVSLKEP